MDIVIKISDDFSENTINAQFINPYDIKWTEELMNTNELKFTLDINDPQIGSIVEYKKVRLYEINGIEDILLWSGYMTNPSNDFNRVFVRCDDEKRYMQKKIIYEDKNWNTVTMQSVLTTLVTELNGRSGESFDFSTNLGTNTITKEFKKGTTYYKILDEIAGLLDAEWTLREDVIIFKDTIGKDRTSGDEFVELVSHKTSPSGNNIVGYKMQRYGNSISTAIIGKSGTSYSEQSGNTETFGYLEELKAFDKGDLVNQTAEYLNNKKKTQTEIEMIVDPQAFGYNDIGIGDRIKVRIDHGSPLIDVDDSVIVLEKLMEVKEKTLTMSLKVGVVKKDVLTPQNFFAKIDQRIKTLEIQ